MTLASKPKQGHVAVRDFAFSYDAADGPIEAAKDVSIDVNPGEFVSIIGPSGCGNRPCSMPSPASSSRPPAR
jgi:ABC-type glutathione transport system ATPase component